MTTRWTGADRPAVENGEFAKFARRIMRAMSRRAATDIDLLPTFRDLQDEVDALIRRAVHECRAEGYSWADIGERLGTTRQGAQQRYGSATGQEGNQRQLGVDVPLPFDPAAEVAHVRA